MLRPRIAGQNLVQVRNFAVVASLSKSQRHSVACCQAAFYVSCCLLRTVVACRIRCRLWIPRLGCCVATASWWQNGLLLAGRLFGVRNQ